MSVRSSLRPPRRGLSVRPLDVARMIRRRVLERLRRTPQGIASTHFGRVRLDVDLSGHPDARSCYFRTHQMHLEPCFRRLLKPGAIFIDVGAGFGYWSALATSLVGTRGQVHAFEPNPHAYPMLRRFAATNPAYHIKANNAALGSDAVLRSMEVHAPAVPSGGSEAGGTATVDRLTTVAEVQFGVFDDYVDWHHLDVGRIGLVRLNVGGWLYDTVDGMRCLTDRKGHRSAFLVVPQRDGSSPSPSPADAAQFFRMHGYRGFDAASLRPIEADIARFGGELLFLPDPTLRSEGPSAPGLTAS